MSTPVSTTGTYLPEEARADAVAHAAVDGGARGQHGGLARAAATHSAIAPAQQGKPMLFGR
jgi:hypothetical protein